MDRQNANLTQEIDEYIRQRKKEGLVEELLSDPSRLKDFFGSRSSVGLGAATGFGGSKRVLDFIMKKLELTFSEKLIQLIEKKDRKPADIYVKAGVTKAHFSKIRKNKDYHPTKETALAFAIALHLDMDETGDLLKRAGYTISHSSESDLIVEFFIEKRIYNIDEINNQLYLRGHKPLTNWRNTSE